MQQKKTRTSARAVAASTGSLGLVNRDGTPIIELRLGTPPRILANTVVDTGFPGALTVPVGSFARWGIASPDWMGSVMLADGTELECPFALLTVRWFGETVEVAAWEFGDGVLAPAR